jgi:RNA-directed DNA polymerase
MGSMSEQKSAEGIVADARSNVRFMAKARTIHKEEPYGSHDKRGWGARSSSRTWRITEKPALNATMLEMIADGRNMQQAWKQVKRNAGAPGVDGVTVDEFPETLRTRWPKIKRALLEGYYVPTPVLRVEILKKSGGTRKLGIPTVLDRVIQQAIAQVLTPVFDPGFSASSFGYRPGRSAQGAVKQVHEYVKQGYRYAVDVDLEKFFDTVNHDILMNVISRKVPDKRVLKLIGRYLRAGVSIEGVIAPTHIGTPQGGPLSPLLSNILLDNLDKELERRGLRFARYADDFIILVKERETGVAILQDMTKWLVSKLKLQVNQAKSKVDIIGNCAYLGFTIVAGKIVYAAGVIEDFRYALKRLTGRSWGVSMPYRLAKIKLFARGWMNYYGIAQYYKPMETIDDWLRRRIRMCFLKQWRYKRTRVSKLISLGIPKDFAVLTGGSNKSYWRLSRTYATNAGMSNAWLSKQGLVNIKQLWCKAQGYA